EPAFPPDEVDRARGQQLAELRQRRMDPGSLASDVAPSRYYEERSPYARALDGTVESISQLGRDHLRDYAERSWRPVGGGLIVVGDVEPKEVERLADRWLGGWSGAPADSGEPHAA